MGERASETGASAGSGGDVYDVVVIGGAFSGAAAAILVKRWIPHARVLVIEREVAFDQKVGEATVEISALFLHRVLGVYDELARTHVPKHGLRYWFSDKADRALTEMSEVGSGEVPRLPAFQLDRAKIDEHLLATAVKEGCELARPARVTDVDLSWPESRVRYESGEGMRSERREVKARWVIDASGRKALLARKLGLHVKVDAHPTAAAWGRWSNVVDMDGPEIVGPDPRKPKLPPIDSARRLATNHFCGYGYWAWAIPLGGGETSIGVVYDKELCALPAGGAGIDRYRAFLEAHPGLRELVRGATLNEADFRRYGHLPYRATKYAGRGWALVGDAASFMDPYYSPGLDHASMSVFATARLIEEDMVRRRRIEVMDIILERHNAEFVRSYDRWLSALYVGKYAIMGDAELTASAFMVDTALYYMGVFLPVHKDLANLKNPTFGLDIPAANAVYRFMRFYNERLHALAEERRAKGIYGKRNIGWRLYIDNFGPDSSIVIKLLRGLRLWGRAEVETLLAPRRAASAGKASEAEKAWGATGGMGPVMVPVPPAGWHAVG